MIHPFWSADGRLLHYTPTRTNPLVRRTSEENLACSIRVSIWAFVRFERIVRKPRSIKFHKLPIKADVRKAISKQAGDTVTIRLDQRLDD